MYRYRVRAYQSDGIVREAYFFRLKSATRYANDLRAYYFLKYTTFANQVDPAFTWEISKRRLGQWDYLLTGGSATELNDMLRGICEGQA